MSDETPIAEPHTPVDQAGETTANQTVTVIPRAAREHAASTAHIVYAPATYSSRDIDKDHAGFFFASIFGLILAVMALMGAFAFIAYDFVVAVGKAVTSDQAAHGLFDDPFAPIAILGVIVPFIPTLIGFVGGLRTRTQSAVIVSAVALATCIVAAIIVTCVCVDLTVAHPNTY